jgi:hypothetical protein
MFYEVMWRISARQVPYPLPWWVQSYFRDWPNDGGGMFGSKQTELASNGLYRYWNMVGVKDAHQESLVGQAQTSGTRLSQVFNVDHVVVSR